MSGIDDDLNIGPIHSAPCNKVKTAADARARAKVKRLLRKTKKPPDATQQPKRQIRSRGFDKTVRKLFDGRVVRREP